MDPRRAHTLDKRPHQFRPIEGAVTTLLVLTLLTGSVLPAALAQTTDAITAPAKDPRATATQITDAPWRQATLSAVKHPCTLAALVLLGLGGFSLHRILTLSARLQAAQHSLSEHSLALNDIEYQHRQTHAARRATEAALEESRHNFSCLVQENQAGILVLDAEGTVLYGNPAASRLLSIKSEQLLGAPFGIPSVSNFETEFNVKRADGSPGVAAVSATETRWQDRFAYLVMLYDITERKQAEEQVRHLAFEDSLTGLPNRGLFFDRLEEAVKRMRRDRHGFALMFMDLNNFKGINDTLGHATGDDLLCAVAQRLSATMRASDTLARMGGDEFTAIFPGVTTLRAATEVAHKLLELFERPFQLADRELSIGTSIGLSLCPLHSRDPRELLRQADSAMYDAKRQAGSGFSVYRTDMTQVQKSRLELEQELREALLHEQFVLFFQPRTDLRSGACVAAEALLRWRHPERGLVAANDFMPILESTGLVVEVGRQTLSMACRQALRWREQCKRQVSVAVNVSPLQLEQSDLAKDIDSVLRDSGISPDALTLEITETAIFHNKSRSTETLTALMDLGVQIHIDNFGSSYTSLEMLKLPPISAVKIDRVLVAGLSENRADRALIEGTIAVAHGLDKRVIAEGIETEEQRRILVELGCDEGQGYLIGQPVPAERLALC
ncbi:EAL domain-containing protein [Thiorhodococcus mannitoliphagus]|uniref:EAL domain-containing protein n=1 Tax=Thiorhodococcus mannitoliphagus TaxID=329406 RepID=A0A6P1DTG0_9GAMM|nr:EAL domain-containing protein [Thiorhodococcus mannitoliphagus]NEX19976.1 EAL domain-containing protein [Thiorhodococcus mannitoliphagus]